MEELGLTFSNVQLANFPSAKLKVDELFNEWISQEGGAALCAILLEAAAQYSAESEGESGEQARSSSSQPLFPRGGLFKSPKKRTQSEMLSNQNRTPEGLPNSTPPKEVPATATPAAAAAIALQDAGSDSADEDHNAKGRRANFDKIPVFYIPGKKNNHLRITSDEDLLSKRLPEIEAFFKPFPAGIPIEKFVHVTKRLCGIPSFFNLPLCRRINERFGDADAGIPPPRTIGRSGRHPSGVKIKLKAFLKFWQAEVEPFDRVERFFRVIKRHDAEYIFKDDFIPFLQELLHFHPGLDFLEAHEEFQRKYALTVITRIFYTVNTSRSGKLSLREVRCSNLFNACMHVDEETDINRVVEYFSYEHFYVLYCKFFELDMDKDSKLTRSDLVKYGEHSLSDAIVDRIFQVGTRVFADGQVGNFEETGMTYPDFIFFMLSEEDKSSVCALRYWFSCCDLDGDGALSPEEMRHFYKNQILRVTNLGQESIQFQDVLCQMIDMVNPKNPQRITIEDMIKPNKRMICGVLFDILFNLHKFMRFETRDPFQEKLRREDVHRSDWDRYAHIEYNRLAQEEEGYDNSMEMDLQQYMDSDNAAHSAGNSAAGGGGGAGGKNFSGGDGSQSWALSDESDDDDDLVYTSK